MGKINTQATVLIVPGLRDHVAEHWQTYLEARLNKVRSVPPLQTDKLNCARRVAAIQAQVEKIEGPIIIVAHSAGVLMTLHWAAQHQQMTQNGQHNTQWIQAALLAAPPNLYQAWPDHYPTPESMRLEGWDPLPQQALAFPSVVLASQNDPLASYASVVELVQSCGSHLLDLGEVGHLNPASGYGYWPLAEQLVQWLDTEQELAKSIDQWQALSA